MLSSYLLAISLLLALSTVTQGAAHHSHGHDQSPTDHRREDFFVDGKNIPGISEYVPIHSKSYAGNLPVDEKNISRTLYFWLVEADSKDRRAHDDLIIWMEGGPGCSSLVGGFREVGPFKIGVDGKNRTTVTRNEESWHKQANILFVEAPIGVGFTSGDSLIKNEHGFAKELFGFYQSFLKVFPEYRTKRVFFVGASYGSFYATYGAHRFQQGGINVGGFGTIDGLIANADYCCEIPVLQYALDHRKMMKLNSTVIRNLTKTMAAVGIYPDHFDHILRYPQVGPIFAPRKYQSNVNEDLFDPWGYIVDAAEDAGQCFDYFNIAEVCPKVRLRGWLGPMMGQYNLTGQFGSLEFRKAMHMPLDKTWYPCLEESTGFVGGEDHEEDETPYLADTPFFGKAIDGVIERGGRVAILHGGYDFRLPYNGTAVAIQNTTWGGKQGMQVKPTARLIVDGEDRGLVHTERNLTMALVDNAGHQLAQYTPRPAHKLLRWLLGRIDDEELRK